MPDNIFKVDTGKISIPDMGVPRIGSIGNMGSALNNIARMQQRQYAMEMARQIQDDKNKAALFGKLSEYGLGAEEDQKRLGFSAMNPAQAEYLKWANGEISKQIESFTTSDSSPNAYAKVTNNIRAIINDPTGLQMRYENAAIKRAADEIEKYKPNLHESYFDEINRHRAAKSLGEYDMNKIVNWKDYAVEPIDLDADLKELKSRGISWEPSVDPNSGKVVVTQTQDNVDYTNKYIGAKYKKNFELDYDRLVANGQDPQMSKEDYVAQRIAETSSGIAIKETTGEFKGNLGNTMEREREEAALEVQTAKQKEADKFEFDKKMEEERRITKATAQEYKSNRTSSGEFTYNSPYTDKSGMPKSGKSNHNVLFKELDKSGVINYDNYDEILQEIDNVLGSDSFKNLSETAKSQKIKQVVNEIQFRYAQPLSDEEINLSKQYKGLGKNQGKMKVTLLEDGQEIDLNEYKQSYEGNDIKIPNPLSPTSPPLATIKKSKTYKSRFAPTNMLPNGDYGGDFMTTNPEFASDTEISGSEANNILGDKVFGDEDKVYVKKGTVKAKEFGYMPTVKGDLHSMIGFMESGNRSFPEGNYDAKNPDTTARGRYQFLDKTGMAIAKKLGYNLTKDEYLEKMKDREFQDQLMAEQSRWLKSSVTSFKRDKDKVEKLKSRVEDIIGEKLDSLPDYIIAYLYHHQGSESEINKYLDGGKGAVIDGKGLEARINAGWRKYKYGKASDLEEQIAAEGQPDGDSYIKQGKSIKPAGF